MVPPRSPSFQAVAEDVCSVLRERGFEVLEPLWETDAVRMAEIDPDAVFIVMAFDTVWALGHFYMAYRAKADGRGYAFYTVVEGRVVRTPGSEWVFRELEFVAASNYVARKLREAGARVRAVIHHGVDVGEIQAAREGGASLRRSLGFSDSDFVVGYFASDVARKGHPLFAEVARTVAERDRSVKFLVLTGGAAPEHYKGLGNVLVVPRFGAVPRGGMWRYYHALDLYAQASLSEGFGLPALEALAAGKPVVHADFEPLTEITTPETSFRVPVAEVRYEGDPTRLRSGILYEHHYYDPREFAQAILEAKGEVLRRRRELAKLCVRRAREFDKRKLYSAFAELLSR